MPRISASSSTTMRCGAFVRSGEQCLAASGMRQAPSLGHSLSGVPIRELPVADIPRSALAFAFHGPYYRTITFTNVDLSQPGDAMARSYRMSKRADARDEVRERILQATMRVHDEQGVAPTTYSDIAERAQVGIATVYRHFPRMGDLIMTCGGHVWQEMRPPTPETAPAVFSGLRSQRERLLRLIRELDAFYERGSHRLALASRDREIVPELHAFLSAVEAGTEALVREALKPEELPEKTLAAALALMSFTSWQAFRRQQLTADETMAAQLQVLTATISARRPCRRIRGVAGLARRRRRNGLAAGLRDDPDVGLGLLPALRPDLLGVLVGDRAGDDDVLALLPVHRRRRPCAWR